MSIEGQTSGCETYIAIVVDESGSISATEVDQIRSGLNSFITSQAGSNTTLSLIGMSNSDKNTRTDHVLEKRISDNPTLFTDWIGRFCDVQTRVDIQSDYWASGLEVVNSLSVTPDIVIVIADGLQVNNTAILKNLYTKLNKKSHIFVYGVSAVKDQTLGWTELTTPLNFYLGKTPVLKETGTSSMLSADYLGNYNFETLEDELSQLSNDLATAQIGCLANVEITNNNLVYPSLYKKTPVHQKAGTLGLRNKSRVPLTLTAGTKIHSSANLNGLVFTLRDTITIPAKSQIDAVIMINGSPSNSGPFSEPMVLDKVKNPKEFTINFNVQQGLSISLNSSKTVFQSPSLNLLAAGSKGIDSTKGIHLRWVLAGELGDKHLPKGTLYTGTKFGFTKPDDFVKVYRSPYIKKQTTLNLNLAPQAIDNQKAKWTYLIGTKEFYVYFDKSKYSINDPSNSISNIPPGFLQAYGNNLIEIEAKNELFFAAEFKVNITPAIPASSILRLETLSVAQNSDSAVKSISSRKSFDAAKLNANTARVVVENGKSIRFKLTDFVPDAINFEFYSDFIQKANQDGTWVPKGAYGLSKTDSEVFKRLEPKPNAVHGKWLKFNDDEYVNIANYKDRWNRATELGDKNIKKVVQDYICLSTNSDNPTASETVIFENMSQPDEQGATETIQNTTEISNLDLLNIAANDYHIARMLGLGCLDMDESVFSGEYVYLTEYTTFGDLKDGNGAREVQHLSMSIPISVENQRLPLPVNLNQIVPGLNVDEEGKEPVKITDADGYSFDGKKRYASLFMEEIMDYGTADTAFFNTASEYEGSTFTFPVYAGIDYKIDDRTWSKPELAHDVDYFNVAKDLKTASNEPVPIIIPEDFQKSFYNVRQEEAGVHTHTYQGYGINIFSRATSGKQVSIDSNIKPANVLMPPSGINSFLITEENPLMFTSQNEQVNLKALKDSNVPDNTYVRLIFDYYSAQELIRYSVPKELNLNDGNDPDSAYNPTTVFPDTEEVLAEHFNIYYRNSLPQAVVAKIDNVISGLDNGLSSEIRISGYTLMSTGETIDLNITDENRFKCGILAIEDQNYIVKEVTINYKTVNGKEVLDTVDVKVINKEVIESIVSEGNATVNSEQIKAITIPENRLCTLVENMQETANWNLDGNPIGLEVEVPGFLRPLHREIIQAKDSEGNVELQLEKTRGIWWDTTKIEKVSETIYQQDSTGQYVLDTAGNPIELQKHLGLYKLTLEGFQMPQHPQSVPDATGNTVEWFNGFVRLFTESSVDAQGGNLAAASRKEFKVVRTENIKGTGDLVLYINDTNFKLAEGYSYEMADGYDEILASDEPNSPERFSINYYPGYKVYLLANPAEGLTNENILPAGESTHYSIFGIRTHGANQNAVLKYDSKISVPSPMYAVRKEEPVRPKKPEGGSYATRPDFFNRSTYTFTTVFPNEDTQGNAHKPYGVLYYRANDEALLSVLYERETINTIRENLERLGGKNELYFGNRWEDFLNFDPEIVNINGENVEVYKEYYYENPIIDEDPNSIYRLPLPNIEELKDSINDFIQYHNTSLNLTGDDAVPEFTGITALNQIIISKDQGIEKDLLAIHFIEQAVQSVFVPLTEVPVIYDAISQDQNYIPVNKKQTIKDKNGHVLKPTDPDFDMAPMMKMVDATENKVQFTDFNLDGTSQNIYFYGVREMDVKMKFGEFSPFSKPVKLVPSNPPQNPEIKRIMPVLENPVLGISPSVQIELNPYQPEHKIRKINVYRAGSMLDAQSIRTMDLVKEIIIGDDTLSADNVWTVYDDFDNLENVPFGEGLFYRVTVSREIEYEQTDDYGNSVIMIDYAPSQPSKISATLIADTVSPNSPVLDYTVDSELSTDSVLKSVVFNWEKTVHNGKYYLYKMNNQGNWDKIHEIVSNDKDNDITTLALDDVNLFTDELIIKTEDGNRIYHHFKIIAQNSSGMFNNEEKILTL